MPTCMITTEVTGRAARVTAISLESGRVTVRELIEGKVRTEIQAWRRRREGEFGSEYRHGEWNVKPGARGVRVEEDAEVESALAAFASGRFLVFVNEAQMTNLEESVRFGADARIRFLRVVALAGG